MKEIRDKMYRASGVDPNKPTPPAAEKSVNDLVDNRRRETSPAPAAKTTERSGCAAVLSFFIPGLGQIYTGRFMAAIFWFILTPLGYLFFILPGVLFHCMAIKDAYDRGQ